MKEYVYLPIASYLTTFEFMCMPDWLQYIGLWSQLKALVNIVVDRLKKNRTVLADLYNYVQMDE